MKDRIAWIMAGLLALLVLIEALFARHHDPVFPWHHYAGYMAAIGLISCVAVVLLSKVLGKIWLQQPEADDEP